jgi:hypothetical protein
LEHKEIERGGGFNWEPFLVHADKKKGGLVGNSEVVPLVPEWF